MVAALLPVWVLVAATALQLVPEVRGQYVYDPFLSAVEFHEFGLFVQWFRGGVVATLVLALSSPLFGVVLLVARGAGALGQARGRAEAARIQLEAGAVPLDVAIVVRKRRKGLGERSLGVRLVEASPLRRLLARAFDGLLLAACGTAGFVFGAFAFAATLDWGSEALAWPLAGGVLAAGALSMVQWANLVDRGATFGKMAVDIRVTVGDGDRPPGVAQVVKREVLPLAVVLAVAAAIASLAAGVAVHAVDQGWVPGVRTPEGVLRVDLAALGWAVATLGVPVAAAGLSALSRVGMLFDRDPFHDWLAGTRVVRTVLADEDPVPSSTVPLGPRLLARGVDGLIEAALMALPLTVAVGWRASTGATEPDGMLFLGALGTVIVGVLVLAGQIALQATTGATVGKRLVGLRVERADGGPVGWMDGGVVRELVMGRLFWGVLPGFGLAIDTLVALGDKRQAVHDHAAGTRVVWAHPPDAEPPRAG